MFLQRSVNGYAISMRDRSSSHYFFALASILAVCVGSAICAERDRQTRTVVELSERELHRSFPELAGLKSAETQTDLPMILQHVGANEDAFLRNTLDLTAREDVVVQQQEHAENGERIAAFRCLARSTLTWSWPITRVTACIWLNTALTSRETRSKMD
jgi:hypothetical protein